MDPFTESIAPAIPLRSSGGGLEVWLSSRRRETPPEQSEHDTRDAQTHFIQQHLRRVFLLIYRIVGNVDDAQDLTQETFIKALQRHGQLKDVERAEHWLLRIASNTAIDHLRKKKKLPTTEIAGVPDPMMISREESPEQIILRGEKRLHLDAGLALLTERERTALLLRDVEDLPSDEVARQMNCSTATVRSHIANARTKFRRFLESRTSR
jgi:RNA polymerase sigma-70 factor (ECF subfamily)